MNVTDGNTKPALSYTISQLAGNIGSFRWSVLSKQCPCEFDPFVLVEVDVKHVALYAG